MGCLCSTQTHEVYIGCLVFHCQTINVSSFALGTAVAVAFFLMSEFCCPDLLSTLARNCCSRVRRRRPEPAPPMSMCPVYTLPSAGAAKGQTLNTGSAMCLAPQQEAGGLGGVVYGQPGDYNFNGQNRPTVYFSQKGMSD